MMAPHFVQSREEGERQIRKAWRYLFYVFPDDLLIVTYEAFAGYSEVRKHILTIDLDLPENPERLATNEVRKEFEVQNGKWYEG
jgi:hypothetical protein